MGTAHRYAQRLLDSVEIAPDRTIATFDEHPAFTWARSGMMALTGFGEGAPLVCPVPIASCADDALAALASIAPKGALDGLRGSALLAERAAMSGFARRGAVSPGGGTYLLDTIEGALAVSLTRDDDWSLVPAWLEVDAEPTWERVRRVVATRSLHDLVERGRLVGLAIAPNVPPPSRPVSWFSVPLSRRERGRGEAQIPLVIDLSSLWAGPLCTRLLQRCGARVIKVESKQRPDGARRGPPQFFERMNAHKESLVLDFDRREDLDRLRDLIARADIVVEASRPRALRQLGIDAGSLLSRNPRLSWISITGYGRAEPQSEWIAYGDDAGVAAGLSYLMQQAYGHKVIVGDAIADPLTGMHAALAAWSAYRNGGGALIALSLVDVVRHCIQFDLPDSSEALDARVRSWHAIASAQAPRDDRRAATTER